MKLLGLVLCIAAIAAPAASAKGRISVALGDSTPRVAQPFTVYVHTGFVVPADDWLRLIAVAPGEDWYDVVGTVTGDSALAHADVPHVQRAPERRAGRTFVLGALDFRPVGDAERKGGQDHYCSADFCA